MKKRVNLTLLLICLLALCNIMPTFAASYTTDDKAPSILIEDEENILLYQQTGWKTVAKDTYDVTWEKGTTVTTVSKIIGTVLSLSPKTIVLAFGADTISSLASSSVGGTLYCEEPVLYQQFGQPLRRYRVKFKDSEGRWHGPYIIKDYNVGPRTLDGEDELK